jgi:arylesterase/paraoxonase
MQTATTIIFIILAVIAALSRDWVDEWITIVGIRKPDIKPYEGGKCRVIKGHYISDIFWKSN